MGAVCGKDKKSKRLENKSISQPVPTETQVNISSLFPHIIILKTQIKQNGPNPTHTNGPLMSQNTNLRNGYNVISSLNFS